jgi:hypothetical protein
MKSSSSTNTPTNTYFRYTQKLLTGCCQQLVSPPASGTTTHLLFKIKEFSVKWLHNY